MEATTKKGDTKSAAKVLQVLDVLLQNFAHGFSPNELVKATGYSASDITRYVSTLESAGFAERIVETNRIRPSVRFARTAIQILNSIQSAESRLSELKQRIAKD